jgi:hypothetical protein
MRSTKVYQGFEQFIDLALIVDSRTICSDLAENLVMKNGAATFFQHLTTKTAVDFCMRISSIIVWSKKLILRAYNRGHTKLRSVTHQFFPNFKHQMKSNENAVIFTFLTENSISQSLKP